jgi:hypothetical protein
MYQLRRQLHRPQDHQYHRHKRLLEAIVDAIKQSDNTIQLIKVKSHTGIVGNEVADQLAGRATGAQNNKHACAEPDAELWTAYDHPGSSRATMFWPIHVWKELSEGRAGQEPSEVTRSRALNDIGTSVKHHMANLLKYGASKLSTVYFTSWRDTEDGRDPCSHHMMHSKDITQAERSTALRYRTGTMYTAKMRHRYKQADTPTCLLCGQVDGGHHTAAGCPALTRMYISRHHKAGQAIARAIADGRHGAHLVMTDVGKYQDDAGADAASHERAEGVAGEDTPEVDPQKLPHRIPISALPENMSHSDKQAAIKNSVPDAFLRCPPERQGEGSSYMIAELKYCRDTDPEQQLQRAHQQHEELATSLRKCIGVKDRVTAVPIMLGVSGGIFKKQTIDTLQQLGVQGDMLTKLKYKLHRIAVKHLHWIHKTKRKKERELQGDTAGTGNVKKRKQQRAGWQHGSNPCPGKKRKS